MKSALLVLALLLSAQYSSAACGGASLSNVVMGDKTIAIEIKNESSGKSQFVIDDDGLVALNVAASFCHSRLGSPRLDLAPSAATCANKAQSPLVYDERVSIFGYSDAYDSREEAITLIKAKCRIDLREEWRKAKIAADNSPLVCAEGVKTLVQKAGARSAEFLREQTTAAKLNELFDNAEDRTAFTAQLRNANAKAQIFVRALTTPPVTTGAFRAALNDLEAANAQHSYALVSSPDETPGDGSLKTIPEILLEMNSYLPYTAQPEGGGRRGRTRCESGISQRDIDIIAAADWRPRATSRSAPVPEAAPEGAR